MEFSKRRFTVLGQVQRPGAYDIPDRQEISLPQAIAIAGGFTRLADVKKVTLTRNEDKGPQVFVLNAHDMESGKDKSQFIVHPNDLISVEESNF
jgi:polysaccharide export outer membrane protein